MGSALRRRDLRAVCLAGLLFGTLVGVVLALSAVARAADPEGLESKLASAREEASSLSAGLQESQARLASAEGEAAAAAAREEQVTALLAEGEERTAELSAKLKATRERLDTERLRLARAREALAERLVAIYEHGTPDSTDFLLSSSDYDELATQATYLAEIVSADEALAERVEAVRDEVSRESDQVAELRQHAIAFDERLAAARDGISAVRESAQAAAGELAAVAAEREASLSGLKSSIGKWVGELREAREASKEEAEEEVGRWLGGPYSIPTYIVMCESGGDYGAVNPSSGAGGAYQIIPSTWEMYGGKGEPQNGSKAEQDRIASEIWADSGTSAWVCG